MAFAAPVVCGITFSAAALGGAQIFSARPVHQRLGAGIGVDGGHGAYGDAEGILQNFGHRRRQLVVQEATEMMVSSGVRVSSLTL